MSTLSKSITPKMAERIVAEVKSNNCLLSDVAKQFGVSTKTVYQLVRQSEQQGGRVGVLRAEIDRLTLQLNQLMRELKLIQG
ncbi:transposase [Shewanella insulae]|uniref:Transposase n=1 Tax=Shewanella insulae TaxID=2681496 RepID=A0A6L7I454_9GAMM|nr:transposase [Shewanella insulae]MCG9713918.1 transposase [Shewanella insulae]MCG9757308.1 transposase [Shewanella insulae]MXR70128.1 transposase [Shewanella insulae]